jgi:beta-xylosidase
LRPAGGRIGTRDAAIQYHDGTLHCYYTASYWDGSTFFSHIEQVRTRDLVHWTAPEPVVTEPPVFWSVGNVLRVGDEWVMCMQDYPLRCGERFAGDTCRLWVARSADLVRWAPPEPINPAGARLAWTKKKRQIDPCIIRHDGRYWCMYKSDGALSMLVSEDFKTWTEAEAGRPVFGPDDTPDGVKAENPSIVHDGRSFVLFFAPCRDGRGVGVARSDDLLHWREARYLVFPRRPWMTAGPNAAMVIDTRGDLGRWLMVFHTDLPPMEHSGFLGLAWSEDLERWTCR